MTSLFTEPKHTWLEISPHIQADAWRQTQSIEIQGVRWASYLNQLCYRTVINWLQDEEGYQTTAWPSIDSALPVWQVVPGMVLSLSNMKMVLIPTDTVGHDELLVPQEWVDIPSWSADYYLSVKVNPEGQWLEIWGYTTHHQLKSSGEYDATERLYCMNHHQLHQDLNALWIIQAMDLVEAKQPEAMPLANLTNTHADNLIQRLINPQVTFPRLSIPFSQWGALLDNPAWRDRLFEQRWNALLGNESNGIISTNLRRVVQGVQTLADAGWQSVEELFGTQAVQLARALRRSEQAVSVQAKLIQLHMDEPISLRLVVQSELEADGRMAIRSQLYPAAGVEYLPEAVELKLRSTEGEVLQSVQARQSDSYIQLSRFRCPEGYEFSLDITFSEKTVTEVLIA